MMIQGVSIGDMINQSKVVLTKPAVATFEQFEKRGGQREALTYVGVAAAIAGIVALVFGLIFGGIGGAVVGLLGAFLLPLIGFFVFAFLVYTVGRSQGGTGTQDEVFYTLALFSAPILAINGAVSNIPILGCLALPLTFALGIYQIYLGFLAIRSSMNLDQNKAIITMVVAWIVQFIAFALIGVVIGIIGGALGVTTGAIPTS
jgi:hypothetical protein